MNIDRINEAVKRARYLQDQITQALQAGRSPDTDDELRGWMQERDNAIDVADRLKGLCEDEEKQQRRVAALGEWLHAPIDPAPRPVPVTTVAPAAISGDRYVARTVANWCGDLTPSPPEQLRAFEAYLRHRARPQAFGDAERRVLETVQGEAGGYTVPADRRPEIIQRVAESARILARCTQIPTSRDTVEWLRIREHPTDGSIYSSGFVGDWVAETPAATAGEAEPKFGLLRIGVRKARTKTSLSLDLVADAAVDILGFLRDNGGENLGLVIDKGILVGTGVGGQPSGVLSDTDIPTVNVEGTTPNTISNTTTNAGSAPKLLDLHYSLPEQYLPGAVYVMRRSVEKAIRKLVDAQGRFLWEPGFGAEPNELLGIPVINSSFMPDEGVDGNKVILFGNLSGVIVAMRQELSVQVDPFSKTDVEQVVFYLRTRLGCGVGNPDAFRIGVV